MSNAAAVLSETLSRALARWSLPITPDQLSRLGAHHGAMVEANRTMNLTRITDPVEAAIKHYADSLALLLWRRDRKIDVATVLDVGTGAGFPAFPLAVLQPDWSVTAIDATRKKIDFVARTAASLGLNNLRCEHAHSEHWRALDISGRALTNVYQLVVFRALSKLTKAIEQASRFVACGGYLVAYQTALLPADEQNPPAADLNLRLVERFEYELEIEDETLKRALYVYRRSERTQEIRAPR